MRNLRPLLFLLGVSVAAVAQPVKQPPDVFDAATVKPAAPSTSGAPVRTKMTGGPGTSDPGRIDYRAVSLASLVQRAYALPFYRLSVPAWMNTTRFDIEARFPGDATEVRFRGMVQDLLVSRFKFASHLETKSLPVYELSLGKNGPKLKVWNAGEQQAAPASQTIAANKVTADADGYPILPPGVSFSVINGGHARLRIEKEKVTNLAEFLSGVADRPVLDRTGLSGEFNFTLSWVMTMPGAPPAADAATIGPDVFAAVEEQLGLKLEPKTASIEVLVVDHAEKAPVEN